MNILLSCVGRRSYMAEYFKKSLNGKGIVIGTNSEAFTSGMLACDKSFVVPPILDKDYIPTLLDIAIKENVSMIISLFDINLPYLAKSKNMFAQHGITVVVSDEKVIDIANDKWKTYSFLKENNINTPLTFYKLHDALNALKDNKLKYPLFLKPRWGMSSIGAIRVDNDEEMAFFYKNIQKQIKNSYLNDLTSGILEESVLIQEYIDGKEYGIDIFNDLNKKYFMSVSKEKLAMRSGETDAAIIVDIPELNTLAVKISNLLEHIGNLDIDVLFDGEKYYVLEMNARFGGGFPFSYLAGADLPSILIKMLKDESVTPAPIKVGLKGVKSIEPVEI